MSMQNARMNTDIDNIFTTAYSDGQKWYFFVKGVDGDNETLGSIYDTTSQNTIVGLLKSIKGQLPLNLQNGFLKTQVMSSLPTGANKIGKVDIDRLTINSDGSIKVQLTDSKFAITGDGNALKVNADGTIGVTMTDKVFKLSDGINALKVNENGTITVEMHDTQVKMTDGVNTASVNKNGSINAITNGASEGSVFGAVTVGVTATPIRVSEAELEGRHTITIVNTGESDIFVGYDETVTVDNGLPIKSGGERVMKLNPSSNLKVYAIAAAETTVRITEEK